MFPLQMLILQIDQPQFHVLLPIPKTVQSRLTNPSSVISVPFGHWICWMTLFLGIHKHLLSLERKQTNIAIKVHLGELMSFVGVTSRNISEELQGQNWLEDTCITRHPFLNEKQCTKAGNLKWSRQLAGSSTRWKLFQEHR